MRVLILGGDGYLGWPTAMHLSRAGHEVVAVDNYLRRRLCQAEDVEPLFEVPTLQRRAQLWYEATGRTIDVRIGDLADWSFCAELFAGFEPEAIVHYAEQPSAPYSMRSRRAADLTLHNNLGVTLHVIQAVREYAPNAHIIKLGTMGEYGTPNIDIEEGWLEIQHKGRRDTFLFPRQAGSLYHTTKIMDTDLLWLYVRLWGLRVTDLMQGPVYGIYTDDNNSDDRLASFLNYDELFGTVLNRFIVQAVSGHPLTIYGEGGQQRGYLNIKDTMQCVALAVDHPAQAGELRIFNQFVETFSVNALAERVRRAGGALGLDVRVEHTPNPRKEAEAHYYRPANTGLLDLGLEPHYLTDECLGEMMRSALRYRERIRPETIVRGVQWG